MGMVDSDSGRTIARMMGKDGVATNDMEYFAAVFGFAMDKLEDEDGVFKIRRYFKDILWPDKNSTR
jgi:hypothetical protein